MQQELFIYIKPTNYCPVGCRHCYLTYSDRKEHKMISINEMEIVKNKIEEYYKPFFKGEKFNINIQWHGGEVLIVPINILKEYINIFKNNEIINFEHSLQTSYQPLFNLNENELKEYGEFFQQNFSNNIGTSFDFFGIRKFNGSEKEYENNLKRIVEFFNNNYNIYSNVNIVINKKFIGNEELVWNWIVSNKTIFNSFQFERYNEYGVELKNTSLKISNREYSYIIQLIENKYFYEKFENLYITLFEGLKNSFIDGKASDKWAGNCMKNFLVINPDGSTNNCVDKSDEESFGNIFEMKLKEIFMNKARIKWVKYQNIGHKHKDCYSCEYSNICNSGCPLINNENHDLDECSGYKGIFQNTERLIMIEHLKF
jgi:radical SAM protein with 4Fe4S-binding SPASM domain